MKMSRLLLAREQEIDGDEDNADGYWAGEGNAASGILPIARNTKRICLAWRNAETHTGDCWGSIGGAVKDGKTPSESAKSELKEETGYTGGIELYPAYVFEDGAFRYFNLVGIVDHEFKLKPLSAHAWETDMIQWVSVDQLYVDMEENPDDYHPGMIQFLNNSRELIEKLVRGEGKTAGWDNRWRKKHVLKPGTILYHGTPEEFEPHEIETPAWFSTDPDVSKQFSRGGVIHEYRVTRPLRLPLIETVEELRAFGERFGIDVDAGGEEMREDIGDAAIPGWYIPHNYGPNGDDIVVTSLDGIEPVGGEEALEPRNQSSILEPSLKPGLKRGPEISAADIAGGDEISYEGPHGVVDGVVLSAAGGQVVIKTDAGTTHQFSTKDLASGDTMIGRNNVVRRVVS